MRAKLRRNCHSLDVEECDKLESQLKTLSTARYIANWQPESTARKKGRLEIENERQKESRPVILFVRRATNVIVPRMAELEEKLVALKQKKPVDSWSVEGCEGELFQLDWELREFQKRFSLCLEPRRRPEFIHVKPKDNEVKLVRLQKLHCQREWKSKHRSLSFILSPRPRSQWQAKLHEWNDFLLSQEQVMLQWSDSLHQMFPVPLHSKKTLIVFQCGLCMLERDMKFQAQQDDIVRHLNEFCLRCSKRSFRRTGRRRNNGSELCLNIHDPDSKP